MEKTISQIIDPAIRNLLEMKKNILKKLFQWDQRICHMIKKKSCRVLTEREVHSLAAKIPPDLAGEVHFSVARGALSKFPIQMGINIAKNKIGEKRWTTPYGYSAGCH